MADAVVKIAEQRDGNRRLAAYSFANDLNLVADFDASKRDFERQVRAVRAAALPSQLYKTQPRCHRQARQGAGRPQGADHPRRRPIRRYGRRARSGGQGRQGGRRHHPCPGLPRRTPPICPSSRTCGGWPTKPAAFAGRSGSAGRRDTPSATSLSPRRWRMAAPLKITLKEPPGPATVTITASFADGRSESVDRTFTVTAPPASPQSRAAAAQPGRRRPRRASRCAPAAWYGRLLALGAGTISLLASVVGAALGLGAVGSRAFWPSAAFPRAAAPRLPWLAKDGPRLWLARHARRQRLALSPADHQRAHRPPSRQRHLPAERFDLATPRAAALQCRQPALRDHRPGRRQRCHCQQGQAAVARAERWRPGGARRGSAALPRQHGARSAPAETGVAAHGGRGCAAKRGRAGREGNRRDTCS